MDQLYVVGFINGVLTVFFDVANQSYLPSLVERDQLVEGNSKLEISRTLAQTAGPAVSGVLVQLVTAPRAILADAASIVGSALFVLGIRRHEPTPDRHVDEHGQARAGLRHEVAEGLRYIANWNAGMLSANDLLLSVEARGKTEQLDYGD